LYIHSAKSKISICRIYPVVKVRPRLDAKVPPCLGTSPGRLPAIRWSVASRAGDTDQGIDSVDCLCQAPRVVRDCFREFFN
jgi:hypothetical protein